MIKVLILIFLAIFTYSIAYFLFNAAAVIDDLLKDKYKSKDEFYEKLLIFSI